MLVRLVLVVRLAAAACLLPAPAAAQYQVDHWTTDDGLPQNSVLALLQTRDGFLWAATPDGLVRFDGLTFTLFNKATASGLTTNRFNSIFEGDDGTMWIGTDDRGVVRYRAGTFDAFDRQGGLPRSVWNIRAAPDSRVTVFTHSGAAVFDGTRFERVGPRQPHQAIARWAPGTRLDPAAVVRFDGRDVVRHPYPPGVEMRAVSRVVEDNHGQLWLVTVDGTYYRQSDGGWVSDPQAVSFDREPRAILIDTRGRVWMPVPGGVSVAERNGQPTRIDLGLHHSGDGIYTMREDREGSLWLGTIRSGLFRIRRQTIDVIAREEGLADDNVYPITEDASGRVWVGTWGGGLHRLSPDGPTRWTARDGLASNQISALFADHDGSMIVGLLHQGIVVIGADDRVRLRLGQALPNRVVSAIARDRAGTLWLGTNAGLVAVRDGAVERTVTMKDGLADHRIVTLLGGRNGLWIGTLGGVGVLKDGAVSVPAGSEGLRGDHIRAIHEDDDGTVWFGTADAGLVRLRDGRITRYTTATGLASDGVFAILDDGAGHFWTSSNRGLARVSRSELDDVAEGRIPLVTARAFTRADGLRTLEANGGRQPAGFRARDGRLWFATARGVAVVDPTRIPEGVAPPPPVIDQVSVGGRMQMRPSAVDVPPGQAFINVEYSVGVLSSPEVVRFRVRLVGVDDQWSDVGRQRSMTYSRLRPGAYRFEVAAVNAGRVGATTSLPIHVRPRFYETAWFGLLVVLLASGLAGWGGHRRRSAQRLWLRREREFARRLLESQDRERARLAAEVHDGLGQQLLVIRNQALLGRQSSNDADPCFESIADTAAQSLEEVRALAAALHPATLERLGLSRALAAMTRTLSRSTPVAITFDASGGQRLAPTVELQLYRIVQESLSNALRHAGATQVAVSIVFDDHEVAATVRDDGRGFSPADVADRVEGSLGLSSIRQRASTIGAVLTLESAPGKGTTVRVVVPLRDRRAEEERRR